ncbi:phage tail protein [Longispora sp. K20-0274]|uniref:phage tail protein n=1 Tax=Longispora sp. K20-0274 TaxID=3088255 RepID=UPI00399AA05D
MDDRDLCLLVQPEQWARCAHSGTALLPGGGVELTWTEDEPASRARPTPAGLAFDHQCRAYRSRPDRGTVTVSALDGTTTSCHQGLRRPLGLAVDRRQRLYVAESGTGLVHVADLTAGRPLRKVPVGCGRPVDVAADCGRAIVLVRWPDALVHVDGRRGPFPGPRLVAPCRGRRLEPLRIARGPLVLWRVRGGTEALVATPDGRVALEVDGATDIETLADGTLVVARAPGQPFRRFRPAPGPGTCSCSATGAAADHHTGAGWVELEPLAAPDYDGGAVAARPDGAVAYTAGPRIARTAGSAARHVARGTVVTYRLDSGAYRTRWGRLFLDACAPPGTGIAVRFVSSDEDHVPDPIEPSPPDRGRVVVRDPRSTPPLPSRLLLAAAGEPGPLYRRPGGSERPWPAVGSEDDYDTFETLAAPEPGRYLWVELTLTGTARSTPRVRAMRIERPGHALLSALPRAWSRDDADADFLHRYLALADGVLRELDLRAVTRAVLVDPHATPREALSWLAGFAGLVLDRRWPEEARRTLVAEAYGLFRRRGTKAALARTVAIYLGLPPVIVEEWQLRGLGGTTLGLTPDGPAAPAVGGAARQTGTLGRFMVGGQSTGDTSYSRTAHRFCLLVPGGLTDEQRLVVGGIIDRHRPAHTRYELVELGPGMRIGARLRVALTSFVGPDAAWAPAVVGRTAVGDNGVVGRPTNGARLGTTSVAGQVRVG